MAILGGDKRSGQLLPPGGLLCVSDTKCQSLALPDISGSEGAFSTPVLKTQVQIGPGSLEQL